MLPARMPPGSFARGFFYLSRFENVCKAFSLHLFYYARRKQFYCPFLSNNNLVRLR